MARSPCACCPAPKGTVALGKDPRQPVDIYAEELDIDDAQKTAHFRGKVVATQGDTTLKTPYLFVKYEGKAAAGPAIGCSRSRESKAARRVTFLWARNGVDVTAGTDRRITSDLADFDAKAETALFVGNVHITQDKNVLDGAAAVRRPQDGQEPARGAGGRWPGCRAHHGVCSTRAKPRRARRPRPSRPARARSCRRMFGSFKSDPNAPMDIEADTLDVHDASKRAVFNGNVWAQQGGMVIRSDELTAIYTGQSGLGLAGSGGRSRVQGRSCPDRARGSQAQGADHLQGRPERQRATGRTSTSRPTRRCWAAMWSSCAARTWRRARG